MASLTHDATSRRLEVWSDQPGLELYTGNFLPEDALKGLIITQELNTFYPYTHILTYDQERAELATLSGAEFAL